MTNREKVIVLMFDLQGTLDNINNENVKILMKQIEQLRMKFEADKAIIFLSSHIYTPNSLKAYLQIFNDNLLPNIVLDEAAYFFGTYNYSKDEIKEKRFGYNSNKTKVFEEKYLVNYDIRWFSIIDDTIRSDYVNRFLNKIPMIVCRPSQKNEKNLEKDNFMCYSTMTFGFDGILECLDSYLNKIKSLKYGEILEKQKKILTYLDIATLISLLNNKDYHILVKYFIEDMICEEDFLHFGMIILQSLENKNYESNNIEHIRIMIESICKKLTTDNEIINRYKYFLSKHKFES